MCIISFTYGIFIEENKILWMQEVRKVDYVIIG